MLCYESTRRYDSLGVAGCPTTSAPMPPEKSPCIWVSSMMLSDLVPMYAYLSVVSEICISIVVISRPFNIHSCVPRQASGSRSLEHACHHDVAVTTGPAGKEAFRTTPARTDVQPLADEVVLDTTSSRPFAAKVEHQPDTAPTSNSNIQTSQPSPCSSGSGITVS